MYTRSPKVYAKRTVALFLTLINKQGVVLTSEKDQAERWLEHFKQVLNHPDADETDNIEPTKIPLDRDLDPPNVNEVRKSILTLKIAKAPKTKFIYYSLYGDVIRRQVIRL